MKYLTIAILSLFCLTNVAEARPNFNSDYSYSETHKKKKSYYKKHHGKKYYKSGKRKHYGSNAKPRKWCGWYMRQLFGGGPEYNRARNWINRGVRTVASVGAIVVWPNHVGVITGKRNGMWVVKSGNDSNRVRERPRSVSRAIGFRRL